VIGWVTITPKKNLKKEGYGFLPKAPIPIIPIIPIHQSRMGLMEIACDVSKVE
jgi:hypothetical protein